ncbi:hypothetical protein [Limnobaculum parvum]|uniref:Uncharacterized protein n=1 Tax=Limnobaculum parvum TaxID=2172103 RepID=A0A2Y9U051_9GAMM|nr:hypothetical protein [Limnobaculum parvum]AWH89408.1 hypothetical protein HYN51_13125 [Limnobaculum parvum]
MKFSYSTSFKSSIRIVLLLCIALISPFLAILVFALFSLKELSSPLGMLSELICIILSSLPVLVFWRSYRKLNKQNAGLIITNQGIEFNFFEIGKPFSASWREIETIEKKENSIRIVPLTLSGKKKKPLNLFDHFDYALDQIYQTLLDAKQGRLKEEPVEPSRKIINQAYQKRTMFYSYSIIAIIFLLLVTLMITELFLHSGGYYWIFIGLIIAAVLSFIVSARFDSGTFTELTVIDSHLIIEYVAFRNMRRKRFAAITIPTADIATFTIENKVLEVKTRSESYRFKPVELSQMDRLYLQDNLINKL